MQQLPLQLQPRESCTFDSYFAGGNQLLVDLLKALSSASGEQQVFIHAAAGLGKSHLLQASCQWASAQGLTASYLPLEQMQGMSIDMLEGIENLELVAVDGVEVIAGDQDWEQALFNLINRSKDTGVRLIFAASASPAEIGLNLPDLVSRLGWGPVFAIKTLSDVEKRQALQQRAISRGLELPDSVASYLLDHYPRDLFVLFENMDRLDKASMAQQRRLTVPFVRQVLSSTTAGQ